MTGMSFWLYSRIDCWLHYIFGFEFKLSTNKFPGALHFCAFSQIDWFPDCISDCRVYLHLHFFKPPPEAPLPKGSTSATKLCRQFNPKYIWPRNPRSGVQYKYLREIREPLNIHAPWRFLDFPNLVLSQKRIWIRVWHFYGFWYERISEYIRVKKMTRTNIRI